MRRHVKNFIQFSSILLILLIFTAIIAQADEPSRLRIVHAAPGISNFNVFLNDKLSFQNVFYRYISDYTPLRRGENSLEVRLAGPRTEIVIDRVNRPLDDDKDFTFITAGTLNHIEWRLLEDDNKLPGTGTSKVRIIHAAFDTPTAEICLADECRIVSFILDNKDEIYKGEYFLMDPGTYFPKVRLNNTNKVHIKIPPLVLQDNGVHTIFLVGQTEGQLGLQLLYTFDAGEFADGHPPPHFPPGKVPGAYPPPAYPPVTGAFLSARVLGWIVGVGLVLAGGVGFWLIRK